MLADYHHHCMHAVLSLHKTEKEKGAGHRMSRQVQTNLSRSPLETDLWNVELDCRPPDSAPSDWEPSRRGSTEPSRLDLPEGRSPAAKEGTDFLLCLLAREATSDVARFLCKERGFSGRFDEFSGRGCKEKLEDCPLKL